MKAIVYTSNTGYTERYARLLGEELNLPVYSASEASKILSEGDSIIYLGWLMAGFVKGYKKAVKHYRIPCICGVGLGDTGAQDAQVRKNHTLPADTALFTLQGGMDFDRLRGINRFMIKMLRRGMESKKNRTPDEDAMLDLIRKGGDYVSSENLARVVEWYRENCG